VAPDGSLLPAEDGSLPVADDTTGALDRIRYRGQ
jgi:hypothetical protein